MSPQGLAMQSPCSAARAMKRSSAHSPRSLGCWISIPWFVIFALGSSKKVKGRGRRRPRHTGLVQMKNAAFWGRADELFDLFLLYRLAMGNYDMVLGFIFVVAAWSCGEWGGF